MTSDLSRFSPTQPLATQAFEQGITQHRLSHGLLCVGQPAWRMYQLAMAAYTVMACEKPVSCLQACQTCRSCRWMSQNAHPGFITISRFSFFVESSTTGDSKADPLTQVEANKLLKHPPTQIHVGQIRYLLQQLSLQAGKYPRMIVFTDATQVAAQTLEATQQVIPPYDWASLPDADGMVWQPTPLKRALFNPASANRFLKTLEEPGANTHFVFLAQQVDDMLPTIQSRCQVIPFQPEMDKQPIPEVIQRFWNDWLTKPDQQFPHQWLKRLLTEVITPEQTAQTVLNYSFEWLQHKRLQWINPLQSRQYKVFSQQLLKVEEMLRSHVAPEAAFALLFMPAKR